MGLASDDGNNAPTEAGNREAEMSNSYHRVALSAAVAGVLVLLSGAGTAAVNEHTKAPVEVAATKVSPIGHSATSRHVRRLTPPRELDCFLIWCGHPFILFLGIGY